jgi:hypothetical protein
MTLERPFRLEQRLVAASMLAAVLATAAAFPLADHYWPGSTGMPTGERLLLAAKTDLFVVLALVIAISDVARRRFLSPPDIQGSSEAPGSAPMRHASAFLQNTLEQAAVAVPAHVALALFYRGSAAIIPLFGTFFCIGRLLFRIGYPHGAAARAFGFAITFYPSVAALIVSACLLLAH